MSIKLRYRINKDGTRTPFIDIWGFHNGKKRHQYKFLSDLKLVVEKNAQDRRENKERIQRAEIIEHRMKLGSVDRKYGITIEGDSPIRVIDWMEAYLRDYKKKDIRNMKGALNRFKMFLGKEREGITFAQLQRIHVADFADYLQRTSKYEGANSYFARFKKMLARATEEGMIQVNPATGVKRPKGEAREKSILTMDEIERLQNTPTENNEIKRAFIFCCFTGLRWIEVKTLSWTDINIDNAYLSVLQSKTEKNKIVPLNPIAIELLGKPQDEGLVFSLPTANGCNKTLRAWVKRAGIKKHISFHCGRHSFGTNLVVFGTDINTVSKLLGHRGLKHTQRYLRAGDQLLRAATNRLSFPQAKPNDQQPN